MFFLLENVYARKYKSNVSVWQEISAALRKDRVDENNYLK